MRCRLLILLFLITLIILPIGVSAAPKIADNLLVAGSWDGTQNNWGVGVDALREFEGRPFLLYGVEVMAQDDADRLINLHGGFWILNSPTFSLGVYGGVADMLRKAAEGDLEHDNINYLLLSGGGIVQWYPFDNIPAGIFAHYEATGDGPIERTDSFEQGGTVGITFRL